MIGRIISHYRILEKLGEGGMGVVYRAEDIRLRRTVALKFLPQSLLSDNDIHARFVREAQTSAALSHPNIATIFGIEEEGAVPFLALEYIEGEDLSAKLRHGPLGLGEAIDITAQLAEGLRHAHAKGIVHRDIKSQNIMVTPGGRAKILDFGLATLRGTSGLTKFGTTLGTMGYMSPEQLTGGTVDHRADIWAVGVVLYEMLTGERPFRAAFDAAVMYQVVNAPHEPLPAIRSDIPESLTLVVDRLLAKQPDQRYQSVDELLNDLRVCKEAFHTPYTPTRVSRWKNALSGKGILSSGIIVAATLVIVAALLFLPHSRSTVGHRKSVAVLPFQNLSDDKQDEYFSDGMTDELINTLVKVDGLHVPARTSVFVFKGKDEDVRRISSQLNVSTVLEGSVRRAGERIRVAVQLINAEDGFTLWAETYERELKDVFAVQDDIAKRIVDVLRVALRDRGSSPAPSTARNLDAYNLFLRGMFHVNKRSANDIRRGLDCFQQAIRLDTLFSQAYAGLSEGYVLLASQAALSPREAYPKALAAALQAVRLDDRSAEAHTCLAHVQFHMGNLQNSAIEFTRAIELEPRYAPAHQFATEYFVGMNQLDSARASIERSLELGPLDLAANATLASILIREKRIPEAITRLRQTLELDSSYFLAHFYLGNAFENSGHHERAADEYRLVTRLTDGNRGWGALATLYVSMGKRDQARSVLKHLTRRAASRYTNPFEIARICAALGDRAQTLAWLEKALDDDPWSSKKLQDSPAFGFLRGEPRFERLLKRIGESRE